MKSIFDGVKNSDIDMLLMWTVVSEVESAAQNACYYTSWVEKYLIELVNTSPAFALTLLLIKAGAQRRTA